MASFTLLKRSLRPFTVLIAPNVSLQLETRAGPQSNTVSD
jgi:hypothetical protein